jgi:hypothetical protein
MEQINDNNIIYLCLTDLKYFIGLVTLIIVSYWLIRKVIALNNELSKLLIDNE